MNLKPLKTELASFFGVSLHTIDTMVNNGMPMDSFQKAGHWYFHTQNPLGVSEETKLRQELLQISIDKHKNSLIPKATVEAFFLEAQGIIKEELLSYPSLIAAHVEKDKEADFLKKMKAFIEKKLGVLATRLNPIISSINNYQMNSKKNDLRVNL